MICNYKILKIDNIIHVYIYSGSSFILKHSEVCHHVFASSGGWADLPTTCNLLDYFWWQAFEHQWKWEWKKYVSLFRWDDKIILNLLMMLPASWSLARQIFFNAGHFSETFFLPKKLATKMAIFRNAPVVCLLYGMPCWKLFIVAARLWPPLGDPPELSRMLCEIPRRIYGKWVCLKIGYIPNYSHLIGIMISKTIGFRGTNHFQTHPNEVAAFFISRTSSEWSIPLGCSALKRNGIIVETGLWGFSEGKWTSGICVDYCGMMCCIYIYTHIHVSNADITNILNIWKYEWNATEWINHRDGIECQPTAPSGSSGEALTNQLIASTVEPYSCCHLRIGMNDPWCFGLGMTLGFSHPNVKVV